MAVITINKETKQINILVEKDDELRTSRDWGIKIEYGKFYSPGELICEGQNKIIMMRGER